MTKQERLIANLQKWLVETQLEAEEILPFYTDRAFCFPFAGQPLPTASAPALERWVQFYSELLCGVGRGSKRSNMTPAASSTRYPWHFYFVRQAINEYVNRVKDHPERSTHFLFCDSLERERTISKRSLTNMKPHESSQISRERKSSLNKILRKKKRSPVLKAKDSILMPSLTNHLLPKWKVKSPPTPYRPTNSSGQFLLTRTSSSISHLLVTLPERSPPTRTTVKNFLLLPSI